MSKQFLLTYTDDERSIYNYKWFETERELKEFINVTESITVLDAIKIEKSIDLKIDYKHKA